MKLSFVTLHKICTNVDLLKDVGMIPYFLAKEKGFDCKVVCVKNDEEYTYVQQYVPLIKVEFLKKTHAYISQLVYIIKNAKRIDILNMYHLSIHNSLLTMVLYKLINRKGSTYLKLDLDFRGIRQIEEYSSYKIILIKKMLKSVDVVSAESNAICVRFSEKTGKKCIYIPDGYYEDKFLHNDNDVNKKNVFLTVGRLGTEQKSTEKLIDAFELIYDKCNWNLELVGPYTDELNKYLETKIKNNLDLQSRIFLMGEVKEKEKLYEIYEQASVFVLPSKWESFGIVTLEAMSRGCYCILSDKIPPADDFIDRGRCGVVYPYEEIEKLAEEMLNATQNRTWNTEYIKRYTKQVFNWETIVERLYSYICTDNY